VKDIKVTNVLSAQMLHQPTKHKYEAELNKRATMGAEKIKD
jgi:hypothetical protein